MKNSIQVREKVELINLITTLQSRKVCINHKMTLFKFYLNHDTIQIPSNINKYATLLSSPYLKKKDNIEMKMVK